jgi:DNA replication protein DnaC
MQGISVVFFTVADLVDLVQQDLKEDRLERRLYSLCKPKLLIFPRDAQRVLSHQ